MKKKINTELKFISETYSYLKEPPRNVTTAAQEKAQFEEEKEARNFQKGRTKANF